MSLYDDFDKHRTSEKVAGWSSSIKLLQSQLQLKKAATTQVCSSRFIILNCKLLLYFIIFSRNVNNIERQQQC